MEYKGYNIVPSTGPLAYTIKAIGSGALPKALRGSYTSYGTAMQQVDLYVDGKAASATSKTKVTKE